MNIKGIYVIATNEILYSRAKHDYRESEDGKCAVDGGFSYFSVLGDKKRWIAVELNGDVLLHLILNIDYRYQKKTSKSFPKGYHGRFKITKKSNLEFFKQLIINFEDVEKYFEGICK